MNTTYINHLRAATPALKDLQLSVEYWQMMYAEAALEVSRAWKIYDEALECQAPREVIEDALGAIQTFEAIYKDTYTEWENAKAQLLALQN